MAPALSATMCNLYSIRADQAAMREAFRAAVDRTGNLPPLVATRTGDGS